MITRERSCLPPKPKSGVHSLHRLHSDTRQADPHGLVSIVCGHGVPVPEGCWRMGRVRVWAQLALSQVDHALQSPTMQFIEGVQDGKLHRWVWKIWTPLASNRLRVCTPSPHVTLHADHGPHSVLHGPTWHVWVWVSTVGHGWWQSPVQPGGIMTARVRVCTPVPAVTLQALQALHSPYVQPEPVPVVR